MLAPGCFELQTFASRNQKKYLKYKNDNHKGGPYKCCVNMREGVILTDGAGSVYEQQDF